MSLDIEILQELRRDIKIIKNAVFKPSKKETWITGSELSELTGWDHRKKKAARLNKRIVFKTEKGKRGEQILYLLESLPEQFIKKTA